MYSRDTGRGNSREGGGGPWSAAPRSSPFMSPSTAASTAARPSPAVTPPAGAWCARRSTSTSAATTPGAELNAVLFCAQLFCAQPPPLPSVFSSTCHPASPAHQRPREGRARARPRARQWLQGRREKDNHPLASQCGGGPAIPPPPSPSLPLPLSMSLLYTHSLLRCGGGQRSTRVAGERAGAGRARLERRRDERRRSAVQQPFQQLRPRLPRGARAQHPRG